MSIPELKLNLIDIRPIHTIDSEEATALLRIVMGDAFGREKSAALWRWKHQDNPAGASLGHGAYSPGGELIALRPFMRWRLVSGDGANVQAVRAVDTVVHPEWRRGGLFSRLTSQALEGLHKKQIAIVFNTPNERSAPGYQKLGWKMLGHPTVWVRPRMSSAIFSRKLGPALANDSEPFKSNGERLAKCLSESPASYGLAVLKDAEFLKWRYTHHPNLSYMIIRAPGATAVVREDQRFGRSGVALVDYFFEYESDLNFGAIFDTVLARTGGAYLICGPLHSDSSRRAAIMRGFVPVPWRNVNLAARPVVLSPDSDVFQSRKAWSLTLGDLETF